MNNSEAYKDLKFSKSLYKTSGNTTRKFSKKVTEEILKRDGYKCIIPGCSNHNLDKPHHVYFGLEANRSENRNDADQLVTLCVEHHHMIHHGSTVPKEVTVNNYNDGVITESKKVTVKVNIREYCKYYLNNYYNGNNTN